MIKSVHATGVAAAVLLLLAPVATRGAASGGDASVAPAPLIAEAARKGDTQKVVALLARKANVNAALADGTTALHWAAYHENLGLVRKLLAAGADPNVASRVAATPPLFLAAEQGNAPIVAALLGAKADANAKSANGTTALMIAAASGSKETVEALLNAGADPNVREAIYGQTALMFAAAKDRAAAIRVLVNRGADPDATSTVKPLSSQRFDDDGNAIPSRTGGRGRGGEESDQPARTPPPQRTIGGNTALTFAAREGNLRAIQALLTVGAGIDVPNAGDQSTPLVVAICNGHFDVARYLLERGANPNKATVDGLTPLYAVIDTQWAPVGWAPNPITDQEKSNHLALMKALLDKGAEVNTRLTRRLWFRPTHHQEGWLGTAGSTAFWRAAQATDIAAMKLLLARGADPKVATDDGDNALMAAAGLGWNGNYSVQGPDSALDTVNYCLSLGIDPLPQDAQGYTAVMGAAYRGDNTLIKLLVAKGAKLDLRTRRGWSVTDMANGPSLRSSVPVKHPETIALLQSLGAPELTATDNEEILGIIRARPGAGRPTPQDASPNASPEEATPKTP
jgi:ankyrin repeat protein